MKTISFEAQMWGHAFHASTWHREEPRSLLQKVADWLHGTRRWSVMVHSSDWPERGDLIRYKTENGIATAKIFDVEPCGNPEDMFTLKVLRDNAIDHQFNLSK